MYAPFGGMSTPTLPQSEFSGITRWPMAFVLHRAHPSEAGKALLSKGTLALSERCHGVQCRLEYRPLRLLPWDQPNIGGTP
ncbi:hypothetical protein PSCLAVI8L_100052 [Pseudoclavibacter sp. 8L]|nr:hypothetical protein PSCLAVI8L_100052 [Pseudoclavibacter sp. 8L]